MEKKIIPILFFILIGTSLFGQNHIRLSFSLQPSWNWMNCNHETVTGKTGIGGFDFGLNGDFSFSEDERYSIASGIMISNVGGEVAYQSDSEIDFSGETLPGKTSIKYNLRYVEVPLGIKLKTEQFHRISYWVLFGMSGMINIDSKGSSSDGNLKKAVIGDEINQFNLAMNIGGGLDFEIGSKNSLLVGLVFQNGLVDVTTNNYFDDKTIVNSMKLKLGILF
jgi:hypothetical protein